MRIYEKVHLVVATPGRILDLMEKKVILHRIFVQFL
jgi:superfamily II DNA/RNA helicase